MTAQRTKIKILDHQCEVDIFAHGLEKLGFVRNMVLLGGMGLGTWANRYVNAKYGFWYKYFSAISTKFETVSMRVWRSNWGMS